jgi:hypothetical protein
MSSFVATNLGAVLRWNDPGNWYKVYVDGTFLVLQKRVNGSYTILGTADFAAMPNTSYTLRFRATGTSLSAKLWPTSSAEPADWMVTATDDSFSSGRFGLRAQIQSDITATYASFAAFDLSNGTPAPIP